MRHPWMKPPKHVQAEVLLFREDPETGDEREDTVTVFGVVCAADPDVGIMSPYVEFDYAQDTDSEEVIIQSHEIEAVDLALAEALVDYQDRSAD